MHIWAFAEGNDGEVVVLDYTNGTLTRLVLNISTDCPLP